MLPRATPRRVTKVTGSEAVRSSDGFVSVVAAGTADCSETALPAKAVFPPLKSRMLALVRRSSKAQKETSQDPLHEGGKSATAKKQAWLPLESAASDSARVAVGALDANEEQDSSEQDRLRTGLTPGQHRQDGSDKEDSDEEDSDKEILCGATRSSRLKNGPVVVAASTCSSPGMHGAESAFERKDQKSLSELARESRKIDGKSLSDIAKEACELVRQQQGSLPHEQAQEQAQQQSRGQVCDNVCEEEEDPIQALERQWEQSIFVDYDFAHQQQLRRVVGLPVQRYPPGANP